jgi:hypothetical protein
VKRARILLAASVVLLLVGLVWSDRGRLSPGPLNSAHARLPALDRGKNCEHCHGGPTEGMTEACVSCHEAIGLQLAQGTGFHGTLASEAANCRPCHVEHAGAEFPLVGSESFALAGFPHRDAYGHEGLPFVLSGRHDSLACRDCHREADFPVLPEGKKRFLGLEQVCASCHEDVHEGAAPDCADCHGEERSFDVVANFDHAASFPLDGSHAGIRCLDCHAEGGPDAFEVLAPGRVASRSERIRACADCHESPHSTSFLVAVAASGSGRSVSSCEPCHAAAHATFTDPAIAMSREEHSASGFALEPPHADVPCEECHPEEASFAQAYPGRGEGQCGSCHLDPHGDQFARGRFAGAECLACHEKHAFDPPTFDVALHAQTAFPLTGAHAAVPCAGCHTESISLPAGHPKEFGRLFAGTKGDCVSCHEDAHEGFFDRSGLLADVERARGCALCHTPDSFSEVAPDFDHGRRTGFPLDGAHAQAPCASCHPPSAASDARGRTFGRATPAGGADRCADCHPDPHGGAFDRPDQPLEIDGEAGCARCHTTESFSRIRIPFDHGRWTGWALTGSHAKLDCSECHPRSPESEGNAFGKARGTDCASCHLDVHVGQFARRGRTDCAKCHGTTTPFDQVRFDHDKKSRFPLDEGHRKLPCSACHLPFPVAGGGNAIRYKPLGTECADCHDSWGRGRT